MDEPSPFSRPTAPPRPGRANQRVDVHCHCLPGLDDGPATMAEALVLCRRLAADGFTTVVGTPHQLGRYDGRNGASTIRSAADQLNRALAADGLPLKVLPGADVRLDERIPEMLAQDEVMTVADGRRYLLLELPPQVEISPVALARELAEMAVTAIVTHPERHPAVRRRPAGVFAWLAEGLRLQLTAGSILGAFGPAARQACWYWLRTGAASLVATDAHDDDARRPCMSAAFAAIARRLGLALARRVCVDNPLRVIRGQPIACPVAPASAWDVQVEMRA